MASARTKRSLEEDEDELKHLPPSKRRAAGKSTPPQLSNPQLAERAASVPQVPKELPEQFQKQQQPPAKDKYLQSESSHVEAPDLQRPPKRPANDEDPEPPRPRKRPGAAARISKEDKDAVLARQKQREEEALKAATTRGVHDAVRQHYNAVPQRGRDWRSSESRIKGLRKFNNWVKSTIIHRFSPPESDQAPPIRVLDLGCGKGGDLGKWQSAPHAVELYVGIDPAEVSIEQARDRYAEMSRGGGRSGRGGRAGYRGGRQQRAFDAEFIVQDAFGQSVANIPIVQNVGFAENGGSRWGGGGFDVVSMMFCMHYAFESEAKTKGMLANVAGSLKKGGRFLGVIPNSDVIRSRVEAFHKLKAKAPPERHTPSSNNGIGENEGLRSPDLNGVGSTDEAKDAVSNSAKPDGEAQVIHNGEPHISKEAALEVEAERERLSAAAQPEKHSNTETHDHDMAEWGNSIYRVRFPGKTPEDGIFRPPYGWKYNYFMEEAVEEVPEYVVPWEAFRAYAYAHRVFGASRLIQWATDWQRTTTWSNNTASLLGKCGEKRAIMHSSDR